MYTVEELKNNTIIATVETETEAREIANAYELANSVGCFISYTIW